MSKLSNDEIQMLLRKALGHDFESPVEIKGRQLRYMAEELLALREENKWVPVDTAMPEIDGYLVLCWDGSRRFVGYFKNKYGNWYELSAKSCEPKNVTHWRKLSSKPEE
jgi:hypothetical protein